MEFPKGYFRKSGRKSSGLAAITIAAVVLMVGGVFSSVGLKGGFAQSSNNNDAPSLEQYILDQRSSIDDVVDEALSPQGVDIPNDLQDVIDAGNRLAAAQYEAADNAQDSEPVLATEYASAALHTQMGLVNLVEIQEQHAKNADQVKLSEDVIRLLREIDTIQQLEKRIFKVAELADYYDKIGVSQPDLSRVVSLVNEAKQDVNDAFDNFGKDDSAFAKNVDDAKATLNSALSELKIAYRELRQSTEEKSQTNPIAQRISDLSKKADRLEMIGKGMDNEDVLSAVADAQDHLDDARKSLASNDDTAARQAINEAMQSIAQAIDALKNQPAST